MAYWDIERICKFKKFLVIKIDGVYIAMDLEYLIYKICMYTCVYIYRYI